MNYTERKFELDLVTFRMCSFNDCGAKAVAYIDLNFKDGESVIFSVCPQHGKIVSEQVERRNEHEVNA